MSGDQRDVIAFLAAGAGTAAAVERIDTHSAIVFLIGDRAYKLKRHIRFSYLDYSTLALRRQACEREVALNRRTAPQLYLAAQPVRRGADGALGFGDEGTILDWVVVMRRFDQSELFDRLAGAGKLTSSLLRDLADAIMRFHAAAEIRGDYGDIASWQAILRDNDANLILASPPFDHDQVRDLFVALRQALARFGELLMHRREAGKVRHCHGDLHLRNICLFEGRPTLFDGIEFSDRIAVIDVLYDIAFLFMDLHYRKLASANSLVFNRYLDLTGDVAGLPALPFFMSVRAAIRAHVAVASARQQPRGTAAERQIAEAQSYFALARQLLQPQAPRLLAIGGLSGSGKSTLAAELASDFAPPPGARVVRSDTLRKRLLGMAPEQRLPAGTYTPSVNARIYRAMREEAAAVLAAGYTALVDATFLDPGERVAIAETARSAHVPFTGLWLDAPAETLARRVAERRSDASDADLTVLAAQMRGDAGRMEWPRLAAGGDREDCLAAARHLLSARSG